MASLVSGSTLRKALPWAASAMLLVWVVAHAMPLTLRADYGLVPSADRFSYESWHTQLELTRNADGEGELAVAETMVAGFPDKDQNKGIVRSIPVRGSLYFDDLQVSDADGGPVPFRTEYDSDAQLLHIEIGTDAYVHGEQTYVVEYTVTDAVVSDDSAGVDDLYWNLLPLDSAQEIEEFSAEIRIDSQLAQSLTGDDACYQGRFGSSDTCQLEHAADSDGAVVFETESGHRAAGDGVTVAVGFRQGTFSNTRSVDSAGPDGVAQLPEQFTSWQVAVGLVLLGLALALAGRTTLARIHARQYPEPASGAPAPVSEVPDTLPPAVALRLLHAGGKGAPTPLHVNSAQIVHLAVQGAICFEDGSTGPASETTVRARLVDANRATHELDRRTLRALFSTLAPDTVRDIPKQSESFSKQMGKIAASGSDYAIRQGLLERPRRRPVLTALGVLSVLTCLTGFALTVLWASSGVAPDGITIPVTIGAIAAAIGVFAVAWPMLWPPALPTVQGWDAVRLLQGVKAHLDWRRDAHVDSSHQVTAAAESSGDDVATQEKLLPYAMLFDLADDWERVLNAGYTASGVRPMWFSGGGHATAYRWRHYLEYVHTSSTYTSSSGSSGGGYSGGSSGGGFSGGGGGGGGSRGR